MLNFALIQIQTKEVKQNHTKNQELYKARQRNS